MLSLSQNRNGSNFRVLLFILISENGRINQKGKRPPRGQRARAKVCQAGCWANGVSKMWSKNFGERYREDENGYKFRRKAGKCKLFVLIYYNFLL